jgi:hypothetical protein
MPHQAPGSANSNPSVNLIRQYGGSLASIAILDGSIGQFYLYQEIDAGFSTHKLSRHCGAAE